MTPETTRDNAFFRQLLFLGVLIAVGVILFKQLNFFVGAFLGSITLYVVMRRQMFDLVERQGLQRWVAALLLVGVSAAALAALGFVLVVSVGSELSNLDIDSIERSAAAALGWVNARFGLDLIPHDIIARSDGLIQKLTNGVLNTTYSFTANIFMMLIVLYFMLTSGRKMEAKLWTYAPFKDRSLEVIKREVKTMIYSNAVGMPVILALQTVVSTLIYWLLGFADPWFWGFLTALCGLIPVLGTMLVYVPVAIWLIGQGQPWDGVILLAYGMTVISNADNVFRIVLLRKVADTHPLVVIFGVLLGIPLFGFWGIIFGPLFISGFILLIKIYYVEYGLLGDDARLDDAPKPIRKSVPHHFKKWHERLHKKNRNQE